MCYEFIPEGAAVNKDEYKEVLTYLQEAVCLKHPRMWVPKDWVHLHENVLSP
jgi:hypothetical protein